jgi:hypothetical protein
MNQDNPTRNFELFSFVLHFAPKILRVKITQKYEEFMQPPITPPHELLQNK